MSLAPAGRGWVVVTDFWDVELDKKRKREDGNRSEHPALGGCRFLRSLSGVGRTSDCFKLSRNKFPSGPSGNRAAEVEGALSLQPLQENRCRVWGARAQAEP